MTELPFTTPTEFAGLAIVLIAGWLFGLATASGGKWRKRYRAEVAERERLARELRDANKRIADLEADRGRLAAAAPGTPVVVEEKRGHSTATVAGAAVAGAATGAVLARKDAARDGSITSTSSGPKVDVHPDPKPRH
jgi:hypothetical protein